MKREASIEERDEEMRRIAYGNLSGDERLEAIQKLSYEASIRGWHTANDACLYAVKKRHREHLSTGKLYEAVLAALGEGQS